MEYRQENILSTVLGEWTADSVPVRGMKNVYYNHRKKRDVYSLYAGQKLLFGRFSGSAGLLFNRTGEYDWKAYGGLDAGVRMGRMWQLFAAVNQSLRYPTFTDLYYESPVSRGNPDLKPEKALTMEGGLRKNGEIWRASAGLYVRRGQDLIDWVREADSLQWHTMNVTSMTTTGLELSADVNVRKWAEDPHYWLRRVHLSYAFAHAGKESGVFLSKYVMDYLRHQAMLEIDHLFPGRIEAFWQFILRDRAGNYQAFPSGDVLPYKLVFLANLRLSYHLWLMDLFVNFSNMFNTDYVDTGSLPQPGIWVTGGIKLSVKKKK